MKINENGRLCSKIYPYFFRKQIARFVNNTCNIAFYRIRYGKNCINIFAYCRNSRRKCKNFKIEIAREVNGQRKATVFSTSINFSHNQKLTDDLRGIERNIAKNKLKRENVSEFRQKTIINANTDHIRCGNLGSIKSEPTLRKVRSEIKNSSKRHDNDLVDLILYMENHQDFIQQISSPFNVQIYSKEQIAVAKSSKHRTLFFDATGSLVRQNEKKRKLYYCGLLRLPERSLCPVMEMLSCRHDSYTITDFFIRFKHFCRKQKAWPLFDTFVTDFSFANLNAACLAFNNDNLLNYLKICYNVVNNQTKFPNNFIKISLCCAHLIKNMFSVIEHNSTGKERYIVNIYKSVIAIAFNIDNLLDASIWYKHLAALLSSPYKDLNVKDALKYFNTFEKCENIKVMKQFEDTENIVPEKYLELNKGNLRKQSPFYNFFKNIYTHSIDNHSFAEDIEINTYYNQNILEILTERYMPFFPLWSAIVTKERNSNALIERWFGFLKYNLLNGNKNQRPTTVIKKIRKHVLKVSKETEWGIPKNKLNIKNRKLSERKKSSDEDLNDTQELWQRKRKPKDTFFSGKYLKCIKHNNNNQSENNLELKSEKEKNTPVIPVSLQNQDMVKISDPSILNNYLVGNPEYYKNFENIVYYIGYYEFVKNDRFISSTEFNSLVNIMMCPKIFEILSNII